MLPSTAPEAPTMITSRVRPPQPLFHTCHPVTEIINCAIKDFMTTNLLNYLFVRKNKQIRGEVGSLYKYIKTGLVVTLS